MIAIYDSERKSLKNLEKMLKKALPSYQFKGFTSLEKCIRFVEEGDTDIVFLDLDSITPPYYAEKIVDSFRNIVCDIDIVLLTKIQRLDTYTAGWALDNQISSVLRKPYQYDALIETLAHIWYHKIPEYDPVLKKQEESVYRDIIAIYDPDRKSMRQLDRMINKALPNYKIEYFEAVQDLIEFVKDTDVTIAFMNIDSLMPLINLQQIVFRLRHEYPRIDIVFLYKDMTLKEKHALWMWAIKIHVASSLSYPYKYDRLIDALEHTWFNTIPEYDLRLKYPAE